MSGFVIFYLCVFMVGFVFVIGSFVFDGEHDADHDHDFSDETMSPSVFSTKVISLFLMGFGLAAALSHYYVSKNIAFSNAMLIDIVIGVFGGIALGALGWWIIKIFMSQQAHSNFNIQSWVGIKSQTTLTTQGLDCGELSATVSGQLRSLDIRSENGEKIPTGTYVEVIRVDGQIGIVRKCN